MIAVSHHNCLRSRMKTPELNDLMYFAQVVSHGGFAAASRQIGVPTSRLSRRIAALEQQLGVQLLQRSTRQFAVTQVGLAYYQDCKKLLDIADDAHRTVQSYQQIPQGIVRMTCPKILLDFRLAGLLSGFLRQHPRVQIQVSSEEWSQQTPIEQLDLALQIEFPPLADSQTIKRRLCAYPQVLVAAPALLAHYPLLQDPQQLSEFPTVDEMQHRHIWQLTNAAQVRQWVQHTPRLVTENALSLRRAVLDGIGVGVLPYMAVFKDLREGRLQHLLPEWQPPCGAVYATFASRQGVSPATRSLLDLLSAELQDTDSEEYYRRYQQSGDEDACLLLDDTPNNLSPP